MCLISESAGRSGTRAESSASRAEQVAGPDGQGRPAKGWAAGEAPVAPSGTTVSVFATGLDHPRWLYVLPNGDVLVAETNAPPRLDDNKGLKGWFFKRFQKKAGGAVPSANHDASTCRR